MKYSIKKIVVGSPGFIEIDEAEYIQIRKARNNLFEALFLEEKIDLVTENYYEYETELLSIASRMMVFHDNDYFSMSKDRNIIGRRIANLMSACRMYIDQSIHHLKNIYGDNSDIVIAVEKEKSRQYDDVLGFRVMEALRNYVQHRGVPIHSTKFAYQRVNDGDQYKLSHTVVPLIKVSSLEEDEKFKKTILIEMKSIQNKDEIDIRPLIREYVEAIGKIHEKIRDLMRDDIKVWESLFDDVVSKYQEKFGNEVPLAGLAIVKENDKGRLEENKTIFKDFIDQRRNLENKNRFFINLHAAYSSNEIRDNK